MFCSISSIFGPYVIDNVACCAYGLDSDCQRNPNDEFLVQTKKMLDLSMTGFFFRSECSSSVSESILYRPSANK